MAELPEVTDTSAFITETVGGADELVETPSEATTEKAEEAKTEPEAEPEKEEQEQERDEQGRFKRKEDELPAGVRKRIQKEIDRAVAARKAAEDAAAQLQEKLAHQDTAPAKKAEPTKSGEPRLEDYETYEQYTRALARYEAKELIAAERAEEAKRNAEAASKAKADSWQERIEAARDKYEDFDDALESITVPITDAVQEAILESPMGADIAYHLANNPKELQRLGKLSAVQAAIEIGKLEAKLTTPKPAEKKPKVSAAPDPIKPVGSKTTTTTKSLYEIDDFTEYVKRRSAGER